MARSIYKGPYIEYHLIRKITKLRSQGFDFAKEEVKTYSRKSTIIPSFIGMTFKIYNGRRFIKVYITEEMVGRKLGEFASTRTFSKHSGAKVRNFVK